MTQHKNGVAGPLIQPSKVNDFFTSIEDNGVEKKAVQTDLIFIPNWNNKPPEKPPVLTLNGIGILSFQNTTAIIAAPGSGKSAVCEAVSASFMYSSADCLGFKVADDCTGIIYIDFERSTNDVWNSFYRMCRRAGINKGDPIKNVIIAGMRSIPVLSERIEAIKYLLDNYSCSLLILDGAGDMVTDSNDLPQAIECRILFRQLTTQYNLSILTTLHPNPNTLKPRGHIGSEIMREADGILVIKKGEGEIRIITTEFEHGKNRNEGHAKSAFMWSVEENMFLSVDLGEIVRMDHWRNEVKLRDEAVLDVKDIFQPNKQFTYKGACENIMETKAVGLSTSKKLLKRYLEFGFIEKIDAKKYQLKQTGQQVKNGSNVVQTDLL